MQPYRHIWPALYTCSRAAHALTAFPGLPCRAAVQFEMSSYDDCIATCNSAVERGRELRADYKQVAKALTRKGNALVKKGDLEDAIEVYHKALTEHRCAQHPKSSEQIALLFCLNQASQHDRYTLVRSAARHSPVYQTFSCTRLGHSLGTAQSILESTSPLRVAQKLLNCLCQSTGGSQSTSPIVSIVPITSLGSVATSRQMLVWMRLSG